MSKFIIEYNPNDVVSGYTVPVYKVYYRFECDAKNYKCKLMTKEDIVKFIDNINSDYYNIETNDLSELQYCGVKNDKIIQNRHC